MAQHIVRQVPKDHRKMPVTGTEAFALRAVLARAAALAGERLLTYEKGSGEFDSPDRSHMSSRNDLEGTALVVRYIPELLARAALSFKVSFENEELPLVPLGQDEQRLIRLIIDPVDGTKAFDNYMCGSDVSLPRPPSAISIAAICPFHGDVVATAVYCFDLGEVYSSFVLNPGCERPQYVGFRGDNLLAPLGVAPDITAKRRVLNGNYNSKALRKLADLELSLMDRGLNPAFGGLSGSSATDIINVVRGSFAACLDVRALCGLAGSVPYWYDIAGAVGVARGRGLRVLVTSSQGVPLYGGGHPIYTPVSFIVARPDVFDTIASVVREHLVIAEAVAA